MEYCGIGSVSDLMHVWNLKLTERQIARVSHGILKGLEYLHSQVRHSTSCPFPKPVN